MTTPLLAYYNGFLESVGGVIDPSTGVVSYERSTGLKPILIDGKELTLPTEAFQRNPDWTRFVPFHPLSESIARGESEVLQKVKELIGLRLFFKYSELCEALLMLGANSESQSKLTPTQMKFLEGLGDADEKTVENFSKILAKAKITFEGGENRCLISLFLKRGGTLNGQKFARLCVVAFPYYEALCKIENEPADKRQVFGVPLRAKDIKVLKRLHEVIVPNSDDGIYSLGTNTQTAPYWGALMMTYTNLANQFNSIIKPFSKVIKSLKTIDTSWDVGDELQQFRSEIPPMPYNEGADSSKPTEPAQTQQQPQVTQPQTIPQPTGNLVQQPATVQQAPSFSPNQNAVHPPAQAVKPSNGSGLSFNDAMNKSGMGMMQQPQMQMPGMMFPQQQMPMYPQQQQMYPQMQMQMPMQQLPMPPVSQPAGQQGYPQQQQMYFNGQLPMPPVSQQQPQGYPQQGYPQMQMPMYPQQQQQMYPGMMPQMQMPGMMPQGYPQQQQQPMFQFQPR